MNAKALANCVVGGRKEGAARREDAESMEFLRAPSPYVASALASSGNRLRTAAGVYITRAAT